MNEVLISWSQAVNFALGFCWFGHSNLFEDSTILIHDNDIIVVNLAGIGPVEIPIDIESGNASFVDDKIVN